MRVKITLSYDGTDFCGWQVQPNGMSVQGLIADAVYQLTGEKVTVTGSGRTDAGVHAKGQVAHFDVENSSIPAQRFYLALNTVLPLSVRATDSVLVDAKFDACRSAKRKTYIYTAYRAQVENPLLERFAVRVDANIDIENMQNASRLFLGEHDFKEFCASGSSAKTTVRTVYDFTVSENRGNIEFSVTGNGFLYNMVRIMVGALIAIGQGKISEVDLLDAINGRARNSNIRTVQAKGLCLSCVEYE